MDDSIKAPADLLLMYITIAIVRGSVVLGNSPHQDVVS